MKILTTIGLMLCYAFSYGQCTNLLLTVDRSMSCAPSKLQYVVHNVPPKSVINWDFGSGYASGFDTAYQFYVNPQKIDVKVSIQMPDKTTCQITKMNFAEIKSIPVPDFTVSRDKLCDGPDTVTLSNITSGAVTLNWVVDGTNYFNAGNSVTHKFKTSGPKKISLFIIDSLGCKGVSEKSNVVTVYADVEIKIVADETLGCVPKSVQFKSNINTNGETLLAYQWSFPGNASSTDNLETPKVRNYNAPGTYNAGLKVATSNGCIHNFVQKDILNFGDSVTLDIAISERSVCVKQEVIIQATNKLPGKYNWVIPGATEIKTNAPNNISVWFDSTGYYDLFVSYEDNKCYTQKFMINAIKAKNVVAEFDSKDNFHCKIPHTVHFNNSSKSSENGTFNFTWRYFDLSQKIIRTSAYVNDSAYFNNWGTYSVALIANHSSGCADTIIKYSHIRLDSMRADFYAWPNVFCRGEEVIFVNATKKSSFVSKDTLYWVFLEKGGKKVANVSRYEPAFHTYYDTGFYDVILYVGNQIGCKDSILKRNVLEIVDPELHFRVSDSIICQSNAINFLAQSLPSRAEFSYDWNIKQNKGLVNVDKDSTTFNLEFKEPGFYDLTYEHDIHGFCQDSITIINYIAINGVKANIILDSSNGCQPFKVKANASIAYDYHEGVDTAIYKYHWSVIGGNGFKLNNDSIPALEVVFNEKGIYRLTLEITNSTGCTYADTSEEINVGVEASFDLNDAKICLGAAVLIKNTCLLKPSRFDWSTNAGSSAIINRSGSDASIKFIKDGVFEIELIASKYGQCFDTLRKKIEVIQVISKPVLQDSALFCAPAYAQFLSKSINADTLIWNFGEGTIVKTTDSFVANIYYKNSGWKKGFDISLIAHNNEGCSDTVVLPGSVKVLGPVPFFKLKNFSGCEPLKVEFINQSEDVQSYFMNFNDGSSLDSAMGLYHQFTVKNYTGTQQYLPTVFVKDSLGCAAIFTSGDTIIVKRKPFVKSKLDAYIGCAPFTAVFNGFGADILSYKWLLDTVTIGDKTYGGYTINNPGNYKMLFIAYNEFGCSDSSASDIRVIGKPEATILSSAESCLGISTTYSSTVTGDTGIAFYNWVCLDDLEATYYQGPLCNITFTQPGRKILSLMIEDEIGCKDTTVLTIDIFDPLKIPKPQISYVTVIDNSTIKVVFENVVFDRFARMNLFKSGTTNPVFSSQNILDTLYFDTYKGSQQNYCYFMNLEDLCGINGGEGREHCQVILNADNSQPFKIKLTWSGYKGWDVAHTYELYRRKGLGKYQKIAELPAYQTSYVDSPLCDFYYEYYVEAVNAAKGVRSQSNSIQLPVFYKFNKIATDIQNVTVDGKHIVVNIKPTVNNNFSNYKLYKQKKGSYGSEIFNLTETEFIDMDVKVNEESYLYSVHETDLCGYVTPKGTPGTSILLDGIYSNNQSFLLWNGYQMWQSGVKEYQLQIEKASGFVTLNTANSLDTGFIDSEIHNDINGMYCYRVIAVSGNTADTSYSNKVCMAGSSKVHMPNAFTPNGNLLNEVFRPITVFVTANPEVDFRDFDFKIYNRWGELLFATHNIYEGWDGTYNGNPVHDGTYLYTLRASGIDHKTYKLEGAVHLIR